MFIYSDLRQEVFEMMRKNFEFITVVQIGVYIFVFIELTVIEIFYSKCTAIT